MLAQPILLVLVLVLEIPNKIEDENEDENEDEDEDEPKSVVFHTGSLCRAPQNSETGHASTGHFLIETF
jgi:hypothetical protein